MTNPTDEREGAEAEFELHCNGELSSAASGPREQAWAEIQRYAAQYAQDGEVTIYEVTRRIATPPGAAPARAPAAEGVPQLERAVIRSSQRQFASMPGLETATRRRAMQASEQRPRPKPVVQRVNDLHEKCGMPRDQARELALSEAGITPDNQWFGDMMILQVLADSEQVNEQEREVLTRWMAASHPPAAQRDSEAREIIKELVDALSAYGTFPPNILPPYRRARAYLENKNG